MKRIVVFLTLFLAAAAHAQCDLDKILPQLDGNRMKATVDKLVSFGTRHSLSPKIVDARTWIFDELSKIPKITVRYQSSTHSGPRTNNQPVEFVNVVATIKGTSDPDRIYVASGHYDSVNSDQKDIAAPAPGADDAPPGPAGIMEPAGILPQHPPKARIVLAPV